MKFPQIRFFLTVICRRNAVCPDTGKALVAALREFEADPTLRVAVITGKDGNFCAGFDLKEV